jgi:hypothetical protein
MRLALFVEGGSSPAPPRGMRPLESIWNSHFRELVDSPTFDPIFPISKKHLIAMDPSNPVMSGCAEGLDALLERQRQAHEFDAAVVAWDLVPRWNPTTRACRWNETTDFYRLLAASVALPREWADSAARRFAELTGRTAPADRSSPPTIETGSCIAIVMEPMFEDLLVGDEAGVKAVLGVSARALPGWPRWRATPYPDRNLIGPAIRALPKTASVRRRVRGDYRTRKDEWAEYILRGLVADPRSRQILASHPVVRRLAEVAW